MSNRVGQIQTVRGLIEPEALGMTLMHEHLLVDLRCLHRPDPLDSDGSFARAPVGPEIRARLLYRLFSNLDDLVLDDEAAAIAEADLFRGAGGRSIVDCTTTGIGRNPEALRRIAEATGLHITMGAGYYTADSHPPDMDERPEDALEEEIVRDIEVGVGEGGIRCGHIGEIGVHYLSPNELKVLRAAARAQRRTGAMLNIHHSYAREDPARLERIADEVETVGGDLARTVLSHMDRTGADPSLQLRLLRRGLVLEYDLFGYETTHADWGAAPSGDSRRVSDIAGLAEAGFLSQLVVSHDICFKSMTTRYGGPGYAHLLERVVEGFRWAGLGDDELAVLFVGNPARLLQFVPPMA